MSFWWLFDPEGSGPDATPRCFSFPGMLPNDDSPQESVRSREADGHGLTSFGPAKGSTCQSRQFGIELDFMTFTELFEEHLKLAVRLHADKPLRAEKEARATPTSLSVELDRLEQARDFKECVGAADEISYERAKYAVDALIDSFARDRFGETAWASRTGDTHVGHQFYTNFIAVEKSKQSADRGDLLELYSLCDLLGILGGDSHLRASEGVQRALNEAVLNSRSATFDVSWSGSTTPVHDLGIQRLHHIDWRLTAWALMIFAAGVVISYWIIWIAFPRIPAGA